MESIIPILGAVFLLVFLADKLNKKRIGSRKSSLDFMIYVEDAVLSLSAYALLLGSLILFIALGAMMYGSLQVKR